MSRGTETASVNIINYNNMFVQQMKCGAQVHVLLIM